MIQQGSNSPNRGQALFAARRNPDVKAILSEQAKVLTGQQQPKKRKRPGLKVSRAGTSLSSFIRPFLE